MKTPLLIFLIFSVVCSCSSKSTTNTQPAEINSRNVYTRNNIEEMIELRYQFKFGEIDSSSVDSIIYKYDKQGNLLKTISPNGIEEYSYSDTLLTKYSVLDSDGKLINRVTYSYNPDNLITSYIEYDSDGQVKHKSISSYTPVSKIDSIYNKSGNLNLWIETLKNHTGLDSISYYHKQETNWAVSEKLIYSYKYDKIGLKLNVIENYDNQTKDKYKHEIRRVNDDLYNQIFEEWNLGENERIIYRKTYQYDQNMILTKYTQEYFTSYNSSYEELYENGLLKDKKVFNNSGDPISISKFRYVKFN